MELAVLRPGEALELPLDISVPDIQNSLKECLCHIQAMILEPDLPEGENQARSEVPMELLIGGKTVSKFTHYFRWHDQTVQLLEDVWARFPMESSIDKVSLKNCHSNYALFISRLSFESKVTKHLEMSLPRWALAGESLTGKIFAINNDKVKIECRNTSFEMDLVPGWNEFDIKITKPGINVKLRASGGHSKEESVIETVYALEDESPEVMVGYDMTVVPHDGNGFMDWLLDYTGRTRLGNTVVFRHFNFDREIPPPPELLTRWAKICRKNHIYVQSVNCHQDNALQEGAGEYMHNAGRHEYPGAVYAQDPEKSSGSADMKEAYEKYIAYLKADIDTIKVKNLRPAYGDASGGHRHCYLAGASFIRSETMVPHTSARWRVPPQNPWEKETGACI